MVTGNPPGSALTCLPHAVLEQLHEKNLSKLTDEFNSNLKMLAERYEKRLERLRQGLELRRKVGRVTTGCVAVRSVPLLPTVSTRTAEGLLQ